MKRFGCFLLVLSALSSAVLAQEAPKPDPKKIALANDTIVALQRDKAFESASTQLRDIAMQMADIDMASALPDDKARGERIQNKAMPLGKQFAQNMRQKLAEIYAEVFTAEELAAIIAFFNSPNGQAFQSKQQQVDQQLRPHVQRTQREIMAKLETIIAEEAPPTPTAVTPPVQAPAAAPAPAPAKP